MQSRNTLTFLRDGIHSIFGQKSQEPSMVIIIITIRTYWRRASIQDGQAFTSAWSPQSFETVSFSDNLVISRRRSKRIAFLESMNFCTCDICKFSIFVMVTWPLFGTLPNAWSQTLQTSKRHTFRALAFHRYHWFAVKLFHVGCA